MGSLRAAFALLTIGALPLLTGSCGVGGKACTLIGCSDQLSVRLKTEDSWPDGQYTLDLRVEDSVERCVFTAPDDLPQNGALTQLACGTRVQAMIWPRTTCVTANHPDGSASNSCQPIPGQFEISLQVAGNPKRFGVELWRDDQSLASDTRQPQYERTYPNGPDCGEGCSQTGYELSFEQ
jgi:hypothetical protein